MDITINYNLVSVSHLFCVRQMNVMSVTIKLPPTKVHKFTVVENWERERRKRTNI